jgi:hypothetical protein
MDFDQLTDALRGGKPRKGTKVASAEQALLMARNWRRYAGV